MIESGGVRVGEAEGAVRAGGFAGCDGGFHRDHAEIFRALQRDAQRRLMVQPTQVKRRCVYIFLAEVGVTLVSGPGRFFARCIRLFDGLGRRRGLGSGGGHRRKRGLGSSGGHRRRRDGRHRRGLDDAQGAGLLAAVDGHGQDDALGRIGFAAVLIGVVVRLGLVGPDQHRLFGLSGLQGGNRRGGHDRFLLFRLSGDHRENGREGGERLRRGQEHVGRLRGDGHGRGDNQLRPGGEQSDFSLMIHQQERAAAAQLAAGENHFADPAFGKRLQQRTAGEQVIQRRIVHILVAGDDAADRTGRSAVQGGLRKRHAGQGGGVFYLRTFGVQVVEGFFLIVQPDGFIGDIFRIWRSFGMGQGLLRDVGCGFAQLAGGGQRGHGDNTQAQRKGQRHGKRQFLFHGFLLLFLNPEERFAHALLKGSVRRAKGTFQIAHINASSLLHHRSIAFSVFSGPSSGAS